MATSKSMKRDGTVDHLDMIFKNHYPSSEEDSQKEEATLELPENNAATPIEQPANNLPPSLAIDAVKDEPVGDAIQAKKTEEPIKYVQKTYQLYPNMPKAIAKMALDQDKDLGEIVREAILAYVPEKYFNK